MIHVFEINFGEHLVGPISNLDSLQVMEAAIRLCARFRTEIVRPFEFTSNDVDVVRAHRLFEFNSNESQPTRGSGIRL